MSKPVPPGNLIRYAGHHWLEVMDCDGHAFGPIVLYWQPVCQEWCHSYCYGTGKNYNADHYKYLAPCPYPDIENKETNCHEDSQA